MKPGNLLIQGAKSGGRREMRIRYTHIESVGVRFFYFSAPLGVHDVKCDKKGQRQNGKETLYFRVRDLRSPR